MAELAAALAPHVTVEPVDGAPATTLLELLALTAHEGDEIEAEAQATDPATLLDLVTDALGYRPD